MLAGYGALLGDSAGERRNRFRIWRRIYACFQENLNDEQAEAESKDDVWVMYMFIVLRILNATGHPVSSSFCRAMLLGIS